MLGYPRIAFTDGANPTIPAPLRPPVTHHVVAKGRHGLERIAVLRGVVQLGREGAVVDTGRARREVLRAVEADVILACVLRW